MTSFDSLVRTYLSTTNPEKSYHRIVASFELGRLLPGHFVTGAIYLVGVPDEQGVCVVDLREREHTFKEWASSRLWSTEAAEMEEEIFKVWDGPELHHENRAEWTTAAILHCCYLKPDSETLDSWLARLIEAAETMWLFDQVTTTAVGFGRISYDSRANTWKSFTYTSSERGWLTFTVRRRNDGTCHISIHDDEMDQSVGSFSHSGHLSDALERVASKAGLDKRAIRMKQGEVTNSKVVWQR